MGSLVSPTKAADVCKRCARREECVRRDDDGRAGQAGTRNQGRGGSSVAAQRACHARPCPALVPAGRPSVSVASPLPVGYNCTPPRVPQRPGQSKGYTRRYATKNKAEHKTRVSGTFFARKYSGLREIKMHGGTRRNRDQRKSARAMVCPTVPNKGVGDEINRGTSKSAEALVGGSPCRHRGRLSCTVRAKVAQ